ncbi:MAG: hypothetical protein EOP13_12850 [Pseudomonas sp.]|uniref:hypothetical protein n=1 Tax=Pseudomonas sp. TaxID=306 RepID=UPI001227DF90|nr:hypothetical protein [Pseudomonas sp.]RZI73175.1 MAG: hypothetical protein EOP13_12850 [Pseudomonas sp.]
MTYELLHHLTQADLPVVIYDQQLIQQLNAYENQSLIVLAQREAPRRAQLSSKKGVQVLKITMAGRRTAGRHLKTLKQVDCISA